MTKFRLTFHDDPTLSAHYLVNQGPTLQVQIGFDPHYQPQDGNHPDLPSARFPALIDTDAFQSCIDSNLAEQLDLPIVGRQAISGALGAGAVNYHLAQIHIPILGYTEYGRFAGVHLTEGGQSYQALLGRTFLIDFNMVYEGPTGAITISSS